MIYVYDLTFNFSEELYDFYDWKDSDNITHFRKIPLIKLNKKIYKVFLNNKIKVDNELLSLIKDKSQEYKGRALKTIKYAALFTNGCDCFGVLFDDEGFSISKTRLLVSEELEVLELSSNLKINEYKYKVVSHEVVDNKFTRKEKTIITTFISKLDNYKDNLELMNYLYYELNGKIYNGKNCYDDLVSDISSKYTDKLARLLEILDIYAKNV